MSSAIEIYICKKGQDLKDGAVEYSQTIHARSDAEQDAQARVKKDPSIHRIAYYKISGDGDFKVFYSFTNEALAGDRPKSTRETVKKKPSAKKKPQKKKSFWQKMLGD